MKLKFYKYHGAGNDFIIIDRRTNHFSLTEAEIKNLCNRRLGIGADGLMFLTDDEELDFEMIYYTADGKIGSFCGNGGRCIADFAFRILKITDKKITFKAADGIHYAEIKDQHVVSLSMKDVDSIEHVSENTTILNTGSPHYVQNVNNLIDFPVFDEGKRIRNLDQFPEGINVNFVENINGILHLRTYERGVENETFACGTGVTAVAIASVKNKNGNFEISLQTKNRDQFNVSFKKENNKVSNVILTGPVSFVYEGIFYL